MNHVISSWFSLPECVPYCTYTGRALLSSKMIFDVPEKGAVRRLYQLPGYWWHHCDNTNITPLWKQTDKIVPTGRKAGGFLSGGWSCCCCCFHCVSSLRVKKLNSQPCILKITPRFVKENHNLKRECVQEKTGESAELELQDFTVTVVLWLVASDFSFHGSQEDVHWTSGLTSLFPVQIF